jgi:hypothetical protein
MVYRRRLADHPSRNDSGFGRGRPGIRYLFLLEEPGARADDEAEQSERAGRASSGVR